MRIGVGQLERTGMWQLQSFSLEQAQAALQESVQAGVGRSGAVQDANRTRFQFGDGHDIGGDQAHDPFERQRNRVLIGAFKQL